jgi:HEAT repeat protein
MRTSIRCVAAFVLFELVASSLYADTHTQDTISVAQLFRQVESEETTDVATSKLLALAPTDPNARAYLTQHLPSVIAAKPTKRQVWLNCVRLAGAFHILETVPQLIKFISAATENAPGTATSLNHLEGFPCAKALVQIGAPAIPQLTEALNKGDRRQKWFAYRCLYLIGSPEAITSLRNHLAHETDPDFKSEIERAIDTP